MAAGDVHCAVVLHANDFIKDLRVQHHRHKAGPDALKRMRPRLWPHRDDYNCASVRKPEPARQRKHRGSANP
jgi:hypothetical protein